MNPYIEYYENQAGNGIVGFQGVKYQRGHSFFGRLLQGAIYPLLRYLGKQDLSTGITVASDVMENKEDIRQAAKRRLIETGNVIAKDAIARARKFQQGEGKTRSYKRKQKPKKRKSKDDNFFI